MRRLGSMLLSVYLGSGCSTAAPAPMARPATPAPSAARAPTAPESAPPPKASATASPAPRPIPDGCTSDVAPEPEAVPLLDQVAKSCLVDMSPVAPKPLLVNLKPGNAKELPFTILDPTQCVRAVATGTEHVEELELVVVDRSDQVLGQDELPGAIAIANLHGPICFESPGQYRAIVRLVQGSGEVAVQVWQAH